MSAPTLEDLTASVGEIDRGLLAGILAPYVRLDRDRGVVLPLLPDWDTLTVDQAVVVYLLACRALYVLGLSDFWYASPSTIERHTGLSGGSVRPALRRLLRQRWVERTCIPGAHPIYSVPPTHLLRVSAWLPPSTEARP